MPEAEASGAAFYKSWIDKGIGSAHLSRGFTPV
jgi:hypothetical protein